MKIRILLKTGLNLNIDPENADYCNTLKKLSEILDHAILKRSDVKYKRELGILELKFKRNLYEKQKRKFLWLKVWIKGKDPTQSCILKIHDVKDVVINDKISEGVGGSEILLGGIHIDDNEIYLGSFCAHEQQYEIRCKVNDINVELEDTD